MSQFTVQSLKKLESLYLTMYPMLRQPGMYKPAKHNRTILKPGQVLALFNEHDSADDLIGAAIYVTAKRLSEVFKDERFSNDELPDILNQHFDFAELILLHHSKRLPGLYEDNVEGIEEKRGEYLSQMANAGDACPTAWTAYAYWLLGRAGKFAESEPNKAQEFNSEAEINLRKAHEAGYIEATEALATHLYIGQGDIKESMALWGKAASAGNITAIENLSAVVMGEGALSYEEQNHSLMAVWTGIAQNKKATLGIAKTLKNSGFIVPHAIEAAPIPA